MAVDTSGWPVDGDENNLSGMYPSEIRWRICDKCGWIFPDDQMRREEHTGLLTCLKDWDSDPYEEKHRYARTTFPFDPEYTEE